MSLKDKQAEASAKTLNKMQHDAVNDLVSANANLKEKIMSVRQKEEYKASALSNPIFISALKKFSKDKEELFLECEEIIFNEKRPDHDNILVVLQRILRKNQVTKGVKGTVDLNGLSSSDYGFAMGELAGMILNKRQ